MKLGNAVSLFFTALLEGFNYRFVRSGIMRWIRLLRKERCLRCEMGSRCLSVEARFMEFVDDADDFKLT